MHCILLIDTEGDIILDANGADIKLKDNGTEFLKLVNSSSDAVIESSVQDKDSYLKVMMVVLLSRHLH